MPSTVVADAVRDAHAKWLSGQGRNGHVRQDSSFRRLLTDFSHLWPPQENRYPAGWMDQYRDAWHLLGLDRADPDRPVMTGGDTDADTSAPGVFAQ